MSTISNKKNYVFTLVSGLGGVFFSIILNLATIPISLNYWKADRYGIWVLLTSILTYLGMTNLGLNTAAVVLMSKNPRISDKMKILKRSLIILLFSVGIILTAFYFLNVTTRGWINFIGIIPDSIYQETYSSCVILVVFYLLSLPFSLLSAVYAGFQKLYIDNIFNILLNIINFSVLLTVIIFKGNLINYATLWGVSLVIFNLIKYLYFYTTIYRRLPKDLLYKDLTINYETEYKTIFSTGMRFFFIGLASTVVWSSDNLLISNVMSVQSVIPYFITFKLFSIVYGIIFQVNNSIMPLLAKEYSLNNFDWVRRVYSSFLVLMVLLGGATWIGSILFFRDFINLWAGSSNYAGLFVVVCLGGYSYLLSMSVLNFGIVNTFNYKGFTPYVSWGEAIVKVIFSIWLGEIWGLTGIAAGSFLGSLFSPTWILPIFIVKRSAGKIFYDFSLLSRHFVFVILPCLIISVIVQSLPINVFLRLLLGILVGFLYLWLSYLVIPLHYKEFYLRHISRILERFGLKPLQYS